MKTKWIIMALLMLVLAVYLCGCSTKFWDPAQVGRFRPVPKVNVILDSLGVAEETSLAWKNAEEPRPADMIAYETDYVFGTGDIVRVTIFELLQEGRLFANDYTVTETGKISIPEVGTVQAEELTESQLEEEIRRMLTPAILKEPSVTVALFSSQRRTFSILGEGVPRPSRYIIPRYDFRLADALATAGGVSQFNISYIYVSRNVTGAETMPEEGETEAPDQPGSMQLIKPKDEMLDMIAPSAQKEPENKLVLSTAEMATEEELLDTALPEGFESSGAGRKEVAGVGNESDSSFETHQTVKKAIEHQSNRIEWIFRNGKWFPVEIGEDEPTKKEISKETKPAPEQPEERLPQTFDWDEVKGAGQRARVIEIPAEELLAGNPNYNIVIKPGDTIHVPVDVIGHFYIMGNTNYQGTINLTGRPMTLKMAIAAAGGLGPLAWPKQCEVIRRISRNEEEIVMVDLDKIANGQQPDFFIKPNDLINVGTHSTSRWRAVLRNAFRATYGFGFIYDRNFGYREFGINNPLGPFDL